MFDNETEELTDAKGREVFNRPTHGKENMHQKVWW
jgi:hypothetical protein